jgi:hypothetical protein
MSKDEQKERREDSPLFPTPGAKLRYGRLTNCSGGFDDSQFLIPAR